MKLPIFNQKGLAHIIVPILFVVAFAVVGGYLLLTSNAIATCKSNVYGQGPSGTCVTDIQKMLNTAAKNWSNLYYAVSPNGSTIIVDGKYGSQTAGRVKKFQGAYQVAYPASKLTQDGVVGPKTWTALCNVMSLGVSGGYSSLSWDSGIAAARSAGCTI